MMDSIKLELTKKNHQLNEAMNLLLHVSDLIDWLPSTNRELIDDLIDFKQKIDKFLIESKNNE